MLCLKFRLKRCFHGKEEINKSFIFENSLEIIFLVHQPLSRKRFWKFPAAITSLFEKKQNLTTLHFHENCLWFDSKITEITGCFSVWFWAFKLVDMVRNQMHKLCPGQLFLAIVKSKQLIRDLPEWPLNLIASPKWWSLSARNWVGLPLFWKN